MNGPFSGFCVIPVDRRELGPVRDPGRPVDRPARGEADESGDRRAHPFDRLVRRGNLLDVHARGQITCRHLTPSLGQVVDRCELPKQIVGSRSWNASGSGAAWVEHLHLRLVAGPEDELRPGSRDTNPVPEVARLPASKPSTIASGWRSRACSTRASGSSPSPKTSTPPSWRTRIIPRRATGSRFPIRARRDTPCTLVSGHPERQKRRHGLGQAFCP